MESNSTAMFLIFIIESIFLGGEIGSDTVVHDISATVACSCQECVSLQVYLLT